jgi:hypothetical protein
MPLRHCPSRIYKYFGPQKDCIESLTQGLLRYTPLGAFNDPFEGRPNIIGLTNDEEEKRKFKEKFEQEKILQVVAEENYMRISEEERRTVTIDDFLAAIRSEIKQKKGSLYQEISTSMPGIIKILSQRIDAHIGACSFSEVPDSLLMWAHYGAWHKGFVVEFDAHHPYFHESRSQEDELRHLRRVLYRSSRTSTLLSELSVPELFLVKSEHWGYEREWRVLRGFEDSSQVIPRPDYPIHLFAFPHEAVTSVILGARIQTDTEEHVRRFLQIASRSGNANLKRVFPDESKFVLHIKEETA